MHSVRLGQALSSTKKGGDRHGLRPARRVRLLCSDSPLGQGLPGEEAQARHRPSWSSRFAATPQLQQGPTPGPSGTAASGFGRANGVRGQVRSCAV
jgi:hypothetical protein